MQTGLHLVQEQRQQLVMTPELRQALSVLQYSATELNAYLQEQVLENPVLDIAEQPVKKGAGEGDVYATSWHGVTRSSRRSEGELDKWWENVSGEQTLPEHMEEQLRFSELDAAERKIARFIIGLLDERGYINISVQDICKRFDIEGVDAERVIHTLQQFEPAGIFARNLQECLLLQIARQNDPHPLLAEVVKHHLQQLADGKWQQVARALDCESSELQQVVEALRRLDPNPGLQLIHKPGNYVIPDVVIEEVNGTYVITVNDYYGERLRIHPEYEPLRHTSAQHSKQVADYLHDRFQAADWLFRSLESRRQTLLNITRVILEYQQQFFKQGIAFLRPMTLLDVAERLEVHESTVSRAIRNKYMQTPRGLVLYKTLFSSGLKTVGGGETSREGVKQQIKEMVQTENKQRPFSDEQLARALKSKGVKISRRTVAKYREELMIPSSTKRRRLG
ncbi:RNA polymerase factor sigma-54 [Numidum massiliense]|uniref:RNA polymerase factor sigma-54 n=1 Tax=Numidum massiliense TaxID=1522315 RepID=UPI0006D58142|nr:RNA polymerase factor sigma-54 [Numidum massiliense]